MSSSLRYILSATAALALASVTQADQVINWGSNAYSTASSVTFQLETIGGQGTPNATWTAPFSIATPTIASGPSANSTTSGFGTGYTGPAIYGGAFGSSANRFTPGANNTFTSDIVIYRGNEVATDVLRVQNAATDANTTYTGEILTARALILFASSNTALGFGLGSSMNLTGARANANGSASARWAVVSGGSVYLSNSTISLNTSNTLTANSITGLAGETFGLWTPTSDFNIAGVTYNTLGSTLAGIQFAGVYYEATNTNAVTSNFNMSAFSLEATTIPEPSTYAAILGLGAMSIVAYRRFKSKKV